MGYKSFVQAVKMEPAYQKQNGREPCSHVVGHILGYKLPIYLLA
jgi:hypothetical protein